MAAMRLALYVLSSFLGLFAQGALGATLEKLSLDEMAARSTAIVRARAVSSSGVMVGSSIFIKTHFQVLERMKGPEASEVDVMEPGGTVGQLSQNYPGVPRFTPGQESLLFLWTGPSGRTQIIGLSQGVLEVTRNAATGDEEVSRQPSGEPMLAPGSGMPVEDEAISMPLRRMVSRIQRAVERSKKQQ